MNSIYLRSITNSLQSCWHHNDKLQKCVFCKVNSCHDGYRFRYLHFCFAYHANLYHMEYDIGAVTSSIFALLWLREFGLIDDVARYIAFVLYKVRKRIKPEFACIQCDDKGFHFVNEKAFCSRICRKTYYENIGYNKAQIRKLTITDKPQIELNTRYIV